MNKKSIIIASLAVIVAASVFYIFDGRAKAPAGRPHSEGSASNSSGSLPRPFNKNQFSTDQANSMWVIVNKGRILPSTYAPANLVTPHVPLRLSAADPEMHVRSDTAAAMEAMFNDAKSQDINLMLASGYRSYSAQTTVYNGYVATDGQTAADASSARPGHSEHQTGLAADIEPTSRVCEVEQCFDATPEGKWLAVNAYRYGFIIRYQKNTQSLTGYEYEPWHLRYVGKELAVQIQKTDQTLEQFFGLTTYADYPETSYVLH